MFVLPSPYIAFTTTLPFLALLSLNDISVIFQNFSGHLQLQKLFFLSLVENIKLKIQFHPFLSLPHSCPSYFFSFPSCILHACSASSSWNPHSLIERNEVQSFILFSRLWPPGLGIEEEWRWRQGSFYGNGQIFVLEDTPHFVLVQSIFIRGL